MSIFERRPLVAREPDHYEKKSQCLCEIESNSHDKSMDYPGAINSPSSWGVQSFYGYDQNITLENLQKVINSGIPVTLCKGCLEKIIKKQKLEKYDEEEESNKYYGPTSWL